MNNKYFYIIISFASLMAALIEPRPYDTLMMILKIFMCGGAFYYVGYHFRKRLKFSLMLILMIIIGVLVNPIIPIKLAFGVRLLIDLLAAFLFYWIGLKGDHNLDGANHSHE